jgi:hypothetical protein
MEFAFIALSVVKAAGAVIGGVEESRQLKANEQSERQAAEYNFQNAHTEAQIATQDAEAQRRRGEQVIGEQTASLGQSGFGLGAGAGQSIEQSASNLELDAMNVLYKGVLRERGEQIGGAQHIGQANAYKAARAAVPIKTAIGAATALLSGAAGPKGQGLSIT